MLGRHLSTTVYQRSPNYTKDESIINSIYTIQEQLLEIVVPLIMLIDYQQSLKLVDILGQGNLNMVSEKSGKSQGILLSIICGNPDGPLFIHCFKRCLLSNSYFFDQNFMKLCHIV